MTTKARPVDALRSGKSIDPVERAEIRLAFARERVHAAIDKRHAEEVALDRIRHYVNVAALNAIYVAAMAEFLNRIPVDRARFGLPPRRIRVRLPVTPPA